MASHELKLTACGLNLTFHELNLTYHTLNITLHVLNLTLHGHPEGTSKVSCKCDFSKVPNYNGGL